MTRGAQTVQTPPLLDRSAYNAAIANYYETCALEYRLVWNGGRGAAMHYGYWDKTTRNLREAFERENQVLAEKVGIGEQDTVLDAGCGVGNSALYLAQRLGCDVTGITLSEKQVADAQRYAQRVGLQDRARFRKMDFHQTDFADRSFDVVWALESACHSQDKLGLVREMARVLKDRGRIVIADGFAKDGAVDFADRALMTRWLTGWCIESLATVPEMRSALAEAGFTDIVFEDITPHILRSSRMMHLYASPVAWLTTSVGRLNRHLETRSKNIEAAYYQYVALKRGLWGYGLFHARLP